MCIVKEVGEVNVAFYRARHGNLSCASGGDWIAEKVVQHGKAVGPYVDHYPKGWRGLVEFVESRECQNRKTLKL